MIYNPITRQQVTIIGRYPPQDHCFRFGQKERGTFNFVRVRYGPPAQRFKGGLSVKEGYDEGTEKDIDVNNLVADEGSREIARAAEAAPLIEPQE